MKYLILFLTILLASCSKDETCQCEYIEQLNVNANCDGIEYLENVDLDRIKFPEDRQRLRKIVLNNFGCN